MKQYCMEQLGKYHEAIGNLYNRSPQNEGERRDLDEHVRKVEGGIHALTTLLLILNKTEKGVCDELELPES